jgi:hypothetical protein
MQHAQTLHKNKSHMRINGHTPTVIPKIAMGASTVKWTTLEPCIGLSESNSKLYTNFEICEDKIHKQLKKNIVIYKAKQFLLTNFFQEKSTYLKGWCKWCANR